MNRILYVSPSANIGGAERSLLELIRALPRDRFEPSLLLPADGPMARAGGIAGARVTLMKWPSAVIRTGRERTILNRLLALIGPILMVPVVARIARHIRRERIDLVHTNGTKAHLGGGLAARITGVPVVWHLRDVIAPGPLRTVLRALARLIPRLVVANSLASARSVRAGGPGGRVQVVYNGIDPNEFIPLPGPPKAREALGLARTDFVIGTLGALAPLKGHIHIIRAMPGVLGRAAEARLLIVGGEMYATLGHAGYREQLVREAERLGVADRVIFAGQREDVVSLYNAMDVVVLASVRPESFGRILVEGMACGRPVIATDLGGPREIVTGPDVGLLVPPGDPDALAEAILSLHPDSGARAAMGLAGRSLVMDRFTIDRHCAEICSIYDRILRTPPAPARPGNPGATR